MPLHNPMPSHGLGQGVGIGVDVLNSKCVMRAIDSKPFMEGTLRIETYAATESDSGKETNFKVVNLPDDVVTHVTVTRDGKVCA